MRSNLIHVFYALMSWDVSSTGKQEKMVHKLCWNILHEVLQPFCCANELTQTHLATVMCIHKAGPTQSIK